MKPTPDFSPTAFGKRLLRESRSGALATLRAGSGDPYCSLINVASAADGSPVMLLSQLAIHTKNLMADPRASIMLDERKPGDPLEGARIMLSGRAELTEDAEIRRRYLDRQPGAASFAGFKDFGFWKLNITSAHLVAGFGRIVDIAPADLLTDLADAAVMVEAEAGICEHMNADHADALQLYAERLLGAPKGEWRCVGCNPEGLEMQDGLRGLWLPFGDAIRTPGVLRMRLKELAEEARGKPVTEHA